jgi:hypothetical protein
VERRSESERASGQPDPNADQPIDTVINICVRGCEGECETFGENCTCKRRARSPTPPPVTVTTAPLLAAPVAASGSQVERSLWSVDAHSVCTIAEAIGRPDCLWLYVSSEDTHKRHRNRISLINDEEIAGIAIPPAYARLAPGPTAPWT